MYGGKPKRPPRLCLIEALPSELRNVTFTGGNTAGQTGADHLDAAREGAGQDDGLRDCLEGLRLHRRRRPSGSAVYAVNPKAGKWTDPGYGQGTWCYRVQIENRYGATRPPKSGAVARYAPVPGAPVVGTPTWRPTDGGWRFTWAAPLPGMDLVVMRNYDEPDQCVTTYDANDADYLEDGARVTPGSSMLARPRSA